MDNEEELAFTKKPFLISLLFAFIIWVVYWVEIQFDLNFNKLGIQPLYFLGLRGILFSPFIHANTSHLINNTIPLFVLSYLLFFFYRVVSWKVLIYGVLLTGFFTWLIGEKGNHIGASGVIYMLFGFLIMSGILKKYYRLLSISLIIIFLYGSMIWYVFPIKDGMSWEGHLSGLLVGVLLSLTFRNRGINKPKIIFKRTEFDELFDEDGNFISDVKEEID